MNGGATGNGVLCSTSGHLERFRSTLWRMQAGDLALRRSFKANKNRLSSNRIYRHECTETPNLCPPFFTCTLSGRKLNRTRLTKSKWSRENGAPYCVDRLPVMRKLSRSSLDLLYMTRGKIQLHHQKQWFSNKKEWLMTSESQLNFAINLACIINI